jgi:excisionase family DNA binding protein
MIEFTDPSDLVKFIGDKLPPKVLDQLFLRKYTWTNNKGKTVESFSNESPWWIYRKLVGFGFAHGVYKGDYSTSSPNRIVLHWTELDNFLKLNDSITHEQKHYSLITINEACQFLSVTRPTIYKLINAGEIPTVQVLTQKRIQLKDLLDYIDRHKK